jgi:RNA polymerase sigma-70 factor, ECF subfamily
MASTLHDEIVQSLPQLRAIAGRMARDRALADDLVQETVLRALLHADQFRPGTNLKAWLATILRNSFFNVKRSEKRLAQLAARLPSGSAVTRCEQEGHVELLELRGAFAALPAAQREALALVGARGFSYQEAARLAGCGVGTIKSRTSRARSSLRKVLDDGGSAVGSEAASVVQVTRLVSRTATEAAQMPLRYAAWTADLEEILPHLSEIESKYVGRYGFDYPQDGEPASFLEGLSYRLNLCRNKNAGPWRASCAAKHKFATLTVAAAW